MILNTKSTEFFILRVGLHHGPWKMAFCHGLTFMVSFLKKIRFAKPLGPSLGVNWMCTKRNEHAPKSECENFQKYVQKAQFWKEKKKSLTILLSSSSLPQKTSHYTFIITTFFYSGPLPFSTRAPLLPLSPQNTLDHVGGYCRSWDMSFGDLELHGHFGVFSLV